MNKSCKFRAEIRWEVAKIVEREVHAAVGLVIIIKMNPFTVQGKAIPSSVREKVIESWLEGKGPTQIGKELRLQKQTIAKIVDNFVRRGTHCCKCWV